MFSYPLKELLLLLSLLHTSIHPSIEQQRSEVLPYPIRFLSDHRSIDLNEQCQDGASKTGCSQAVMGGTEGEGNQGGPTYRTAATAEVIIVIESDVYDDAVGHCNE